MTTTGEPTSAKDRNILLGVTAVGGAAILTSYALAIGNAGNMFAPVAGEQEAKGDYFNSPFWMGISQQSAKAITGLQLMAAIGFIVLILWRALAEKQPSRGLLHKLPVFTIVVVVFLMASLAWPWLARWALTSPTPVSVGLCVLSLIVAALSVILLIADTFEAGKEAPWYALTGVLFLGLIVVLADGVGWSASMILAYKEGRLPKKPHRP